MAESYGEWLRRTRRAARMSQSRLADRSGVSVRTISDLERGRGGTPRPRTVQRLATALTAETGGERPAGATPTAELRLLGRFRILGPDGPVMLGSAGRTALVAYLALHASEPVPVDELAEVVWPHGDRPGIAALHSLLSRVRTTLAEVPGGARLDFTEGYRLDPGGTRVDLTRFRELIAQAGPEVPADPAWRRAIGLVGGSLLADVPSLAANPTVIAARQEVVAAVLRFADSAAADTDAARLVTGPLTRLLRDEPLHEGIARRLMTSLAATGRPDAAIDVYRGICRRLDAALGVAPGADLVDCYERLRPGPTGTVLPQPQPRYAGAAPGPTPAQLPADVSDFVGRDAQEAALRRALATASRRAVAVIRGPDGIGKTTFAVHLGRRMRPAFPDGQIFLDLRGRTDDPLGIDAASGALLRAAGLAEPPRDPAERLRYWRERLSAHRMLVVLDDVRDAAQVAPLLPAAAGSAVLVIGRNLARLPDAALVTLPPLRIDESLSLLARVVGAERVDAEPDAARDLARRCAGVPLALRAVADRLAARPTWTLRAYADRLAAADQP